jgi:hypothetical protein
MAPTLVRRIETGSLSPLEHNRLGIIRKACLAGHPQFGRVQLGYFNAGHPDRMFAEIAIPATVNVLCCRVASFMSISG